MNLSLHERTDSNPQLARAIHPALGTILGGGALAVYGLSRKSVGGAALAAIGTCGAVAAPGAALFLLQPFTFRRHSLSIVRSKSSTTSGATSKTCRGSSST